MIRVVIDRNRIDASGGPAVMNSVSDEIRQFMNTVEKDIGDDAVLVVEASLWSKKYLDQVQKLDKEKKDAGESSGAKDEERTTEDNEPDSSGSGLEGEGHSEDDPSKASAEGTDTEGSDVPEELNLEDEFDPLKDVA